MRVQTGTYTGNGEAKSVALDFKPDLIIGKADSLYGAMWTRRFWSSRANRMGAVDSLMSGMTSIDQGFTVGGNVNTNTNAATFHYLALAEDGSKAFDTEAWQGNGVTGLVIDQYVNKSASAIIIKRDNAGSAVVRQKDSTFGARFSAGTGGASAFVTSIGTGSFTLSNSGEVNEFNGTGGIGEGTTALLFFEDSNSKLVTWTGDGTSSKSIPTGLASIKGALIWGDNGSTAGRFKTDTMEASSIANVSNGAFVANELSFSGANLVTGSAASLNANGAVYHALVFGPDSGVAIPNVSATPTVAAGSGRKIVSLPGRATASRIEFGTSDTIALAGAMSIEMLVRPYYFTSTASGGGAENMLLMRSGGPIATQGNLSWCLGVKWWSTLGWEAQFFGHVTSFIDIANTPADIGHVHRTGCPPTPGHRWMHVVHALDSNGKVRFYINGKCAHQRDIDMVAKYTTLPNGGAGGSGYRTTAGASWDGSAYTNPGKIDYAVIRVYNKMLSAAEVLARYNRSAKGLSDADVTSGLVEEWDAVNASGSSFPATFNSANNGTIVNGSVVTL